MPNKLTAFSRAAGTGVRRGAGAWMKWGITGIILGFIIINAFIIAYQEKDIEAGAIYLGEKLLSPMLTLQEESQKIIASEGIAGEDGDKASIFQQIKVYWRFLTSIYLVFFWLIVFEKMLHWVLGDNIPKAVRFFFSAIIFLTIQVIFLLAIDQSPMIPFYAVRDFGRAFPYLTERVAGFGDSFLGNKAEINATELNTTLTNIANTSL